MNPSPKDQTALDHDVVPMPLFLKIKEAIRQQILNGTYTAHDKLPSEREMIAIFGTSRVTVRQALSDLQREGMIFKINGKGTFVSKPKASFDASKLRGFGETVSSMGYETFSRVISIREEEPETNIVKQLHTAPTESVIKIQRLRYMNREPTSLDVTYATANIGKILASADLVNRDIFQILENECGIYIRNAQMNIAALLSDAPLSRLLEIEESSSILHVERIIFADDNQPILYENLFYKGDVFKYGLNIEREHLPSPTVAGGDTRL